MGREARSTGWALWLARRGFFEGGWKGGEGKREGEGGRTDVLVWGWDCAVVVEAIVCWKEVGGEGGAGGGE